MPVGVPDPVGGGNRRGEVTLWPTVEGLGEDVRCVDVAWSGRALTVWVKVFVAVLAANVVSPL